MHKTIKILLIIIIASICIFMLDRQHLGSITLLFVETKAIKGFVESRGAGDGGYSYKVIICVDSIFYDRNFDETTWALNEKIIRDSIPIRYDIKYPQRYYLDYHYAKFSLIVEAIIIFLVVCVFSFLIVKAIESIIYGKTNNSND